MRNHISLRTSEKIISRKKSKIFIKKYEIFCVRSKLEESHGEITRPFLQNSMLPPECTHV